MNFRKQNEDDSSQLGQEGRSLGLGLPGLDLGGLLPGTNMFNGLNLNLNRLQNQFAKRRQGEAEFAGDNFSASSDNNQDFGYDQSSEGFR